MVSVISVDYPANQEQLHYQIIYHLFQHVIHAFIFCVVRTSMFPIPIKIAKTLKESPK